MRRFVIAVGALASLGLGVCEAQAQHHRAAHKWCDEWMFNNMWPQPFMTRDRQAVRAPFAIMIDKGWQLQNTLGDHHFDAETQQLTKAGELHLRWIVTQAPESRRTVFVLRGHNETATSIRVDTVQQMVAQLQPRGALPAVVQTSVAPPASPADYVDDVNQKAIKARPAPVLPAAIQGGSGTSGS